MANGVAGLSGITQSMKSWLAPEDLQKAETDGVKGLSHQEIIAFVQANYQKFSTQITQKVQELRQKYQGLSFTEDQFKEVLFGDPKAVAEKLNLGGNSRLAKAPTYQLEDSKKAAETEGKLFFQLVLEIDPNNPKAYLGLARLAYLLGKPDSARGYLQSAAQHISSAAEAKDIAGLISRSNDSGIPDSIEWVGKTLIESGKSRLAAEFLFAAAQEHSSHYKLELQYKRLGYWAQEKANLEIGKLFPREFSRSDYQWSNLDLGLRARGIPSDFIDGQMGPEYHVPDGKLTERDLILYVGTHWEKDPQVQAALQECGIPEEEFWRIHGELLREEFGRELLSFESLVKDDPEKAKEKRIALDSLAGDMEWHSDGAPREEQIENLKLMRRYFRAGVELYPDPQVNQKGQEYLDQLVTAEADWARLVQGRYPGADDLDAQGFVHGDALENAKIRTQTALKGFVEKREKTGKMGDPILASQEAVAYLLKNTEFPLLPAAAKQEVLDACNLTLHFHPDVYVQAGQREKVSLFYDSSTLWSAERRVAHGFYLKAERAQEMRKWDEAGQLFEKALEHAPESGDLRMAAAQAYFQMARIQSRQDSWSANQLYHKAHGHVKLALNNNSEDWEAWKLKGDIQWGLGEAGSASFSWENALDIAKRKNLAETVLKDLGADIKAANQAASERKLSDPAARGMENRYDDKWFEKGRDALPYTERRFTAELDVSGMSFGAIPNRHYKIQDLLMEKGLLPEQVRPGRNRSEALPTAAEYQEYAFQNYSKFKKEIELVYGPLPFSPEGKLPADIQEEAKAKWDVGAKEIRQRLSDAGLQPGTPEFNQAFQAELTRPDNEPLLALKTLLDPQASTRLKALAFIQYQASDLLEFSSSLAKYVGTTERDGKMAIEAYRATGESYEKVFNLSQKPKDAKAAALSYFAAANLARKQGDEVQARKLFFKGTAVLQGMRNLPHPDNLFHDGEALELMGHALREAGKYPEAMQIYTYAAAAGNNSASVREAVTFLNKYQLSLEQVDAKFLKRFQLLEAKEETGKLSAKEKKELAKMRRGLELLKQACQELYPGWENAARVGRRRAEGERFFPSGIQPVGRASLEVNQWGSKSWDFDKMQEKEIPLIRNLRSEVMNSLKLPLEEKRLKELKGDMARLQEGGRNLQQLDQMRRELLTKYPAYVQDYVLETGDWGVVKLNYDTRVDNYGQNWEDIPPEWNPESLNKLHVWTDIWVMMTADPAGNRKVEDLMAGFGRPALINVNIDSLADFEAEIQRLNSLAFKTETRLDPQTGAEVSSIPVDPLTGEEVYELRPTWNKLLGREEKADPAENPTQWVRTEIGRGMQDLGNTRALLKTLTDAKKEYQETKSELETAQKKGDTIRAEQLEKKLSDQNQKIAVLVENSKKIMAGQTELFGERSNGFMSALGKLNWLGGHSESYFSGTVDNMPFGDTHFNLDNVPQDPEKALEALLQQYGRLSETQTIYIHHLAIASAGIANQWTPQYDITPEGLIPHLDRYDMLFSFEPGSLQGIDRFLKGTQAFLEKADRKMFQDLPGNIRDGVDAQLINWRKIEKEMDDDHRIGEVRSLIRKYENAQAALEKGDVRKALSLFQLATDSKNQLYAQDAYKSYKKWESIKTFALELAIIAVATVLTGGAAAAFAPGVMAAGGWAALAVQGTTFFVMERGVRAGLYYGFDVGHNPFKDSEGSWLMPWDYAWEWGKVTAMFGALQKAGKVYKGLTLANAEMRVLAAEAFTLSGGRAGGRVLSQAQYTALFLEQRYQVQIAQMGWLRRQGFKAGELVTEAVAFQVWNNIAATLDVMYQGAVHGRNLDWWEQIKQVNSPDSIIHGLAFLGGLKLGNLIGHPATGAITTKRAKAAQKAIQADLQPQAMQAFRKHAADFQSRLVSYEADPSFKYLSSKDIKDAKRLIAMGDKLYFPETKKGLDTLELGFLSPEQRAWLEARDVLTASIRYSQEKGAPKPIEAAAPATSVTAPIAPPAQPAMAAKTGERPTSAEAMEPMPDVNSPEFASMVEGFMSFTSESQPGPKAREAVKKWVQENVTDQGHYRQVLVDLAGQKQVLTLHEGKAILENYATVRSRLQEASRVYQNLAEEFRLDPAKQTEIARLLLERAGRNPQFDAAQAMVEMAKVLEALQPAVKSVASEHEMMVRQALFAQVMEGKLSLEAAQDLALRIEMGSIRLEAAAPDESSFGYKLVPAFHGVTLPMGAALLVGESSAAALPAETSGTVQRITVGGKGFEVQTIRRADQTDSAYRLSRSDQAGEVWVLKAGKGDPQPVPVKSEGKEGILLEAGDVLVVNGEKILLKSPLEAAKEALIREHIIQIRQEIAKESEEIKALPEGSAERTQREAELAKKQQAFKERLADFQDPNFPTRTLDGTPLTEVAPHFIQKIADPIFHAKGPVDRVALRNRMVSALEAQGIKLSTDNAKSVDSIIDLALTARDYGIIDKEGGLTSGQFYQVIADLFTRGAVRITGVEFTHVPKVVEGTLMLFEAATGKIPSTADRTDAFLAAVFHDAGKYDLNIRTKNGYTISSDAVLNGKPINKTGQDIVVPPGKTLSEVLIEMGVDIKDMAKVKEVLDIPFPGLIAVMVHHDALTVRGEIKSLVDRGIVDPLRGQRIWEAIQYHGFVSSWIVKNSLGGIGIRSHVFGAEFEQRLQPYFDAYQVVSKKLGEHGLVTVETVQTWLDPKHPDFNPSFAREVRTMREAFEALPELVKALMLGDHFGQADIAKYMDILAGGNSNAHDLLFGKTMSGSVMGVLRTHPIEQFLLSPLAAKRGRGEFTRAEDWINVGMDKPGLKNFARPSLAKSILEDAQLRTDYLGWLKKNPKGTLREWLKTVEIKKDAKPEDNYPRLKKLVEEKFNDRVRGREASAPQKKYIEPPKGKRSAAPPPEAKGPGLPVGEVWGALERSVDPASGEVRLRVKPKNDADPTKPLPVIFEGDIRFQFTRYPELAEKLGIKIHEDGSVSYPDVAGLNKRLEKEGANVRFYEPKMEDIDPLTGEVKLEIYLSHIAQDIPAFPISGKGKQHFHDLGAHGLGLIMMPKQITQSMRETARTYLKLMEEGPFHYVPGGKRTPLANFLRERMLTFVADIDGQSNNFQNLATGERYLREADYHTQLGIDLPRLWIFVDPHARIDHLKAELQDMEGPAADRARQLLDEVKRDLKSTPSYGVYDSVQRAAADKALGEMKVEIENRLGRFQAKSKEERIRDARAEGRNSFNYYLSAQKSRGEIKADFITAMNEQVQQYRFQAAEFERQGKTESALDQRGKAEGFLESLQEFKQNWVDAFAKGEGIKKLTPEARKKVNQALKALGIQPGTPGSARIAGALLLTGEGPIDARQMKGSSLHAGIDAAALKKGIHSLAQLAGRDHPQDLVALQEWAILSGETPGKLQLLADRMLEGKTELKIVKGRVQVADVPADKVEAQRQRVWGRIQKLPENEFVELESDQEATQAGRPGRAKTPPSPAGKVAEPTVNSIELAAFLNAEAMSGELGGYRVDVGDLSKVLFQVAGTQTEAKTRDGKSYEEVSARIKAPGPVYGNELASRTAAWMQAKGMSIQIDPLGIRGRDPTGIRITGTDANGHEAVVTILFQGGKERGKLKDFESFYLDFESGYFSTMDKTLEAGKRNESYQGDPDYVLALNGFNALNHFKTALKKAQVLEKEIQDGTLSRDEPRYLEYLKSVESLSIYRKALEEYQSRVLEPANGVTAGAAKKVGPDDVAISPAWHEPVGPETVVDFLKGQAEREYGEFLGEMGGGVYGQHPQDMHGVTAPGRTHAERLKGRLKDWLEGRGFKVSDIAQEYPGLNPGEKSFYITGSAPMPKGGRQVINLRIYFPESPQVDRTVVEQRVEHFEKNQASQVEAILEKGKTDADFKKTSTYREAAQAKEAHALLKKALKDLDSLPAGDPGFGRLAEEIAIYQRALENYKDIHSYHATQLLEHFGISQGMDTARKIEWVNRLTQNLEAAKVDYSTAEQIYSEVHSALKGLEPELRGRVLVHILEGKMDATAARELAGRIWNGEVRIAPPEPGSKRAFAELPIDPLLREMVRAETRGRLATEIIKSGELKKLPTEVREPLEKTLRQLGIQPGTPGADRVLAALLIEASPRGAVAEFKADRLTRFSENAEQFKGWVQALAEIGGIKHPKDLVALMEGMILRGEEPGSLETIFARAVQGEIALSIQNGKLRVRTVSFKDRPGQQRKTLDLIPEVPTQTRYEVFKERAGVIFSKAWELISRLRVRTGAGSAPLPGQLYLAPEAGRVGDFIGLKGRRAAESTIPDGASYMKLSFKGDFEAVLGEVQKARLPNGDKPEYLVLHVEDKNGHHFIVVDKYENLNSSDKLLSHSMASTSSNNFYLGFKVENGKDGTTRVILDQMKYPEIADPQGKMEVDKEKATTIILDFLNKLHHRYPEATIVAHPKDRLMLHYLSKGLILETSKLSIEPELLDALKDWNVLTADEHRALTRLKTKGRETEFKERFFEYMKAASERALEPNSPWDLPHPLEYFYDLLLDKQAYLNHSDPRLREQAQYFDQVFNEKALLESTIPKGDEKELNGAIIQVLRETRVSFNFVEEPTGLQTRHGPEMELVGIRANPLTSGRNGRALTLTDAQLALEAFHDVLLNAEVEPLKMNPDGTRAGTKIRYQYNGEIYEIPVFFEFQTPQNVKTPSGNIALEVNPYDDIQISHPEPHMDPVAARHLSYAQSLEYYFMADQRPEMAAQAKDYAGRLEDSILKGEAAPPPPFTEGYTFKTQAMGSDGKRLGIEGELAYSGLHSPTAGQEIWTVSEKNGNRLSLQNTRGEEVILQIDPKGGGRFVGQLEVGDKFLYQETGRVPKGKGRRPGVSQPQPDQVGRAAAVGGDRGAISRTSGPQPIPGRPAVLIDKNGSAIDGASKAAEVRILAKPKNPDETWEVVSVSLDMTEVTLARRDPMGQGRETRIIKEPAGSAFPMEAKMVGGQVGLIEVHPPQLADLKLRLDNTSKPLNEAEAFSLIGEIQKTTGPEATPEIRVDALIQLFSREEFKNFTPEARSRVIRSVLASGANQDRIGRAMMEIDALTRTRAGQEPAGTAMHAMTGGAFLAADPRVQGFIEKVTNGDPAAIAILGGIAVVGGIGYHLIRRAWSALRPANTLQVGNLITHKGRKYAITETLGGLSFAYDLRAPKVGKHGLSQTGDVKNDWKIFVQTPRGPKAVSPQEAARYLEKFHQNLIKKQAPITDSQTHAQLQKVFDKPYGHYDPTRPWEVRLKDGRVVPIKNADYPWPKHLATPEEIGRYVAMMPRQFFAVVEEIQLSHTNDPIDGIYRDRNSSSYAEERVGATHHGAITFIAPGKGKGLYSVVVHEGIGHGVMDGHIKDQHLLWVLAKIADGRNPNLHGKENLNEGVAHDLSDMFSAPGEVNRKWVEKNPNLARYYLALLSGPKGMPHDPQAVKAAAQEISGYSSASLHADVNPPAPKPKPAASTKPSAVDPAPQGTKVILEPGVSVINNDPTDRLAMAQTIGDPFSSLVPGETLYVTQESGAGFFKFTRNKDELTSYLAISMDAQGNYFLDPSVADAIGGAFIVGKDGTERKIAAGEPLLGPDPIRLRIENFTFTLRPPEPAEAQKIAARRAGREPDTAQFEADRTLVMTTVMKAKFNGEDFAFPEISENPDAPTVLRVKTSDVPGESPELIVRSMDEIEQAQLQGNYLPEDNVVYLHWDSFLRTYQLSIPHEAYGDILIDGSPPDYLQRHLPISEGKHTIQLGNYAPMEIYIPTRPTLP